MNYIGVSDLKKSREMWKMLAREKELVLTRDGKPGALIVQITPEGLEGAVAAVRRALFSETVSSARRRASKKPISAADIEAEIQASRAGH
jgi:hypothetical protein